MNSISAADTLGQGFSAHNWQIVQDNTDLIERIVDSKVRSGIIHKQNRDDAIGDGRLLALGLAQRRDVRNFRHLLARTLSRRLFDQFRPGTDALDRVSTDEMADVRDPILDNPVDNVRFRSETVPPQFDLSRVPERWRPLAQMAHNQHHSVSYIAKHTGYSPHLVRRMVTHTLRLLADRKDQNGRLLRRQSKCKRPTNQ